MIITYHGKQFFKIQAGETVLACNPIGKGSKEKPASKFGADIVFVTTAHPDYNGVETVTYGDKVPFVIDGPGNYEVKEIFAEGWMVPTTVEKSPFINTIYTFEFDDIKVCFLGHITSTELSAELYDRIGEVDILFVPVALDPSKAHKLAISFEPKVIIPMDYGTDTLKTFLKEGGSQVAPEPKFTVKKKDLLNREADVVVLSA